MDNGGEVFPVTPIRRLEPPGAAERNTAMGRMKISNPDIPTEVVIHFIVKDYGRMWARCNILDATIKEMTVKRRKLENSLFYEQKRTAKLLRKVGLLEQRIALLERGETDGR